MPAARNELPAASRNGQLWRCHSCRAKLAELIPEADWTTPEQPFDGLVFVPELIPLPHGEGQPPRVGMTRRAFEKKGRDHATRRLMGAVTRPDARSPYRPAPGAARTNPPLVYEQAELDALAEAGLVIEVYCPNCGKRQGIAPGA